MAEAIPAGPCPRCQSTDTKRTTVRPPRKHPGNRIACDPECEQTVRLCLTCRMATPLSSSPKETTP